MSRPLMVRSNADGSVSALVERWTKRATDYAQVQAQVDGATICRLVVEDLEALARADELDVVTLREAAEMGGYSYDHIQREVKAGRIENVGAPGRPRIRRAAVPLKPGYVLRRHEGADHLSARRRIVASVIQSRSA